MKTPGYFKSGDDIVWDDDTSISISPDKTQSISYLRLDSNKVYSYGSYRFYFIPGRKERDRDGQRIHLTVFLCRIVQKKILCSCGKRL